MPIFFQDFRYAVRQLRRKPGFACTAILILGLGIGATTAIFSAVNPILFEPLPYPQARQIMMIWYAGDDRARPRRSRRVLLVADRRESARGHLFAGQF